MDADQSRRYPIRPVVGVGAIIIEGDWILLVERGREPLKGQWSLPGGAVESGERLEAAVIREVREETGFAIEPLCIATIFERIIPDELGMTEYHYVLIDYVCRIAGGTLCAGDDCKTAQWVHVDDLADLPITAGTREVIASVRAGSLPAVGLARP